MKKYINIEKTQIELTFGLKPSEMPMQCSLYVNIMELYVYIGVIIKVWSGIHIYSDGPQRRKIVSKFAKLPSIYLNAANITKRC